MDTRTCKTCNETKIILNNFFVNKRGYPNTSCIDCSKQLRKKPRKTCSICNKEKPLSMMKNNEDTCIRCDDNIKLSKVCSTCKINKDIDEFGKSKGKIKNQCKECRNKLELQKLNDNPELREKEKERAKARYPQRKEKHKEIVNKYREENQSLYKENWIRKAYGLTLNEKNKMRDDQDNKCYICKIDFENDSKANIDHCHETGKIRGLLCRNCNTLLGLSKDKIEILSNAIKYLERDYSSSSSIPTNSVLNLPVGEKPKSQPQPTSQ